PQSGGAYPYLSARETLAHWATLYPAPRPVDEVLALAGLEEAADRRVRTLSGGQRRRLDFALALVGDPELIFLDQPTTGFDPAARPGGRPPGASSGSSGACSGGTRAPRSSARCCRCCCWRSSAPCSRAAGTTST